MRKTSQEITEAFYNGTKKSMRNTKTDGNSIWLHGNLIAEKKDGYLFITNAGWQTNTTKERLNALNGVNINQKAGKWYLNGQEWDGSMINTNITINGALDNFILSDHVLDCDISYRGGTLKIDVSSLFPELAEANEEAIMGAYQNYLGGGIAGSIQSGSMFDENNLTEANRAIYRQLQEKIKRYFYDLNNGGGDEYMQENVTGADAGGYEATQKMARSAY